jgi:nucleoside-diphosphate-sugar epimerase
MKTDFHLPVLVTGATGLVGNHLLRRLLGERQKMTFDLDPKRSPGRS